MSLTMFLWNDQMSKKCLFYSNRHHGELCSSGPWTLGQYFGSTGFRCWRLSGQMERSETHSIQKQECFIQQVIWLNTLHEDVHVTLHFSNILYFLMFTFVISGNWNRASSTPGSEIALQWYLLDLQTPKLSICVYCVFSNCVCDSKHDGTINFAFSSLILYGFYLQLLCHYMLITASMKHHNQQTTSLISSSAANNI